MSLIAGSWRRAHPTSSHFDSGLFPWGITNGYRRGRARVAALLLLLLPDSIPLRVISGDFLRGASGRREGKGRKEARRGGAGKGRKEGSGRLERNADRRRDNRLRARLPCSCVARSSNRLSAPTTSSRLGNRSHLNQRRAFTATNGEITPRGLTPSTSRNPRRDTHRRV